MYDSLDVDIRLDSGNNEREGRVEILYQGIWGNVMMGGMTLMLQLYAENWDF